SMRDTIHPGSSPLKWASCCASSSREPEHVGQPPSAVQSSEARHILGDGRKSIAELRSAGQPGRLSPRVLASGVISELTSILPGFATILSPCPHRRSTLSWFPRKLWPTPKATGRR